MPSTQYSETGKYLKDLLRKVTGSKVRNRFSAPERKLHWSLQVHEHIHAVYVGWNFVCVLMTKSIWDKLTFPGT